MRARLPLRLLALLQSAWLVVGATLLCVILAEMGAATWLWFLGPKEREPFAQEAGPKVWLETPALRCNWKPYVHWRARPLPYENVAVDDRGLRRTWNPGRVTSSALKVFVFGGSTAWGVGARDDFTIPSLLSKLLAKEPSIQAVVTNFGQLGYVSTQELVTLVLELQRGNIPDVVVFYDGVNDAFASYQAGRAGVPMEEAWRILDYEHPPMAFLHRLARRSQSLALINRVTGGFIGATWAPPTEVAALAALERDTVKLYAENIWIGQALAAEFGFDPIYYWQPVVWSKRSLSPSEAAAAERAKRDYPFFDVLCQKVYTLVQTDLELQKNGRFRDISGAFNDCDYTVLWDFCHTTEQGNQLLAEAMHRDVQRLLATRADRLSRRGIQR